MSCFFCDSLYHLSQNCDIYSSDESRRNFAKSKSCCVNCFHRFDELPCKYCKSYIKCYICFSNSHHTFLCQERNKVVPFFIPNINEDLLPRFIQLLNLEDQYSLAFSSPLALKSVKLKRLLPRHSSNKIIMENTNINFIITDSYYGWFDKSEQGEIQSFNTPLRSIIFKCKKINVSNGEFTAQEFMQFFSVHLICGCFRNMKLLSTVTFESIIKAAPNMDSIYFYETNIVIESSWPDDILKWKNGNGLANLDIPIEEFNFDMKKLVTVLREKSKPSVRISFDITNMFPNILKATESHQKMVKKLEKIMSSNFKFRSIKNSSYYGTELNINFTFTPDQIKKPIFPLLRYLSITNHSITQRTTSPTKKLKRILLNIKR